ncbi:MAG: hypothetical protein MI974_29170 [Chitinophagales bacterium]|nr:hypothetical protein [Chitinophagales bacterium]
MTEDTAKNLIKKKLIEDRLDGYTIYGMYPENFGWVFILNLPPDENIVGGTSAFLIDKESAYIRGFSQRHVKDVITYYQRNNGYVEEIRDATVYYRPFTPPKKKSLIDKIKMFFFKNRR